MQHKVVYIMGVSGSGKTTIGKLLSAATGFPFYDADDFHSAANVQKMKDGHALTDEDRLPWLNNIHEFVVQQLPTTSLIFACSALRANYRQRLCDNIPDQCRWVFLKGDYNTIQQRILQRTNHYMPATLLQSQFDALEIPTDAITVDIANPPASIVQSILPHIR